MIAVIVDVFGCSDGYGDRGFVMNMIVVVSINL